MSTRRPDRSPSGPKSQFHRKVGGPASDRYHASLAKQRKGRPWSAVSIRENPRPEPSRPASGPLGDGTGPRSSGRRRTRYQSQKIACSCSTEYSPRAVGHPLPVAGIGENEAMEGAIAAAIGCPSHATSRVTTTPAALNAIRRRTVRERTRTRSIIPPERRNGMVVRTAFSTIRCERSTQRHRGHRGPQSRIVEKRRCRGHPPRSRPESPGQACVPVQRSVGRSSRHSARRTCSTSSNPRRKTTSVPVVSVALRALGA